MANIKMKTKILLVDNKIVEQPLTCISAYVNDIKAYKMLFACYIYMHIHSVQYVLRIHCFVI